MGKHSNFLSKTLKTIPYPKKGSDRRPKDKEGKLSQLEEELAQHKRQESLISKQLADVRAESALWQKKYEQLHAMVGRHICEQQQPHPKDPRPSAPQRRSTTRTLSSPPTLSTTPEEEHSSAQSTIEKAVAITNPVSTPAKPSQVLALTLSPPSRNQPAPCNDDNNETTTSPTTSTLSTTTTLTPSTPSTLTPSSSPHRHHQQLQPYNNANKLSTIAPQPQDQRRPQPQQQQQQQRQYPISPRLAVIPLLFLLSASTRFAQRGPVYPTYLDAANARRPVHAPGSVVQLLGLNLILVAVLGEGARWFAGRRRRGRWRGRFHAAKEAKAVGGFHDDGGGGGEEEVAAAGFVAAVCDEAWGVLLMAILAFALLLFEVRDFAFF